MCNVCSYWIIRRIQVSSNQYSYNGEQLYAAVTLLWLNMASRSKNGITLVQHARLWNESAAD